MMTELRATIAGLINSRLWHEHPEPFEARTSFTPKSRKQDLLKVDVTVMPESRQTEETRNRDQVKWQPTVSICIRQQVNQDSEHDVAHLLAFSEEVSNRFTNDPTLQTVMAGARRFRRLKTEHDPMIDWRLLETGIFSSFITLEFRQM